MILGLVWKTFLFDAYCMRIAFDRSVVLLPSILGFCHLLVLLVGGSVLCLDLLVLALI